MMALAATPAPPTKRAPCLECGTLFAVQGRGEFCCDAHRKAWNNRRLIRGAELYDLFMALRFDRHVAKRLKVWTLICRAASFWREEDRRERDGRKSWGSPAKVIDRRPYLHSITVVRGRR